MTSWFKEVSMTGKTVIVTGGNRGIGQETTLQLAKRGARVIMACRNIQQAEQTKMEISMEIKAADLVVMKLDLNSLKNVRAFANKIIQNESRLDVLICNAGNGYNEKDITEDGFECTFSTNYLGHFLLVIMLLPLLRKTEPSRIILVSSILYLIGSADFENWNAEKSYGTIKAYGNSKLAMILFTKELSRKLQDTRITVNAVHPGLILTDLISRSPWLFRYTANMCQWFCRDIVTGARTTVYLAVSGDVADKNGRLFYWCRDIPVVHLSNTEPVCKRLWDVSCEMVNLKPSLDLLQ